MFDAESSEEFDLLSFTFGVDELVITSVLYNELRGEEFYIFGGYFFETSSLTTSAFIATTSSTLNYHTFTISNASEQF